MAEDRSEHDKLVRRVYVRVALAIPVIAAILFIPAGTLRYWEAWLYLAVILLPMFFALHYLLKHEPQLLERRMQVKEREVAQRWVVAFASVCMLLIFILPGLGKRWGWASVPWPVVLAADLVVLLGYGLVLLVFRTNQYTARTIQVEAEQQVISTGPYAVVRHPMYVGVLLMYLASPLALGSWWAFLPALLLIPIFTARILNEEQVLERELPGYREYKLVTRYRLLPGIW